MTIYKKKISVGAFAKKGEDYNEGDILTIANEGKQIEGQFGTQDIFLVKLPKGEEKNMAFNQTSINNIIDAYGEEARNWIGKQVKVWMIRQSVSGKLMKVTYLSHPNAEMLDDLSGSLIWDIPGKETKQKVELKKPEGYPEEEINPDDIPF